MTLLDKETIINKQCQCKLDMKKRKQKEKRTERITLRCTPYVKEQFEKKCKKSDKSQSEVFEEMVQKNKVVEISSAKEASIQLCLIYSELRKVEVYLQNQNIPGAAEYIKLQTEKVENNSNKLFQRLRKEV